MIEVRDLKKRYGAKEALRGVDFTLGPGVTGLLGPNGAGKTTLLRCILGIIAPTSGDVIVQGADGAPGRAIGYLPQKYGLLKELTVFEALEYFAVLKKLDAGTIAEEIDQCLKRVNLLDSKDARVGTLSGGMTRRVGIAAALLGAPPVLVFDEPTAGLDPEERVRFKRLVSGLAEDHSVLISTHIVEDIEAVASHVVVLDGGLVAASGTLAEIAARAEGRCFLAPANMVNEYSDDYYVEKFVELEGESFARVLSARQLEGFAPAVPTIEDGYLALTRGVA